MRFTLNGTVMDVEAEQVVRRLAGVQPEAVREHAVRVADIIYPVKQAFEVGIGVRRQEFTSQTARRLLSRMGFEVLGEVQAHASTATAEKQPAREDDPDPHGWPWEGYVQSLFAGYLQANGWMLTAMADTATKAPGVDRPARAYVWPAAGSRGEGLAVQGVRRPASCR